MAKSIEPQIRELAGLLALALLASMVVVGPVEVGTEARAAATEVIDDVSEDRISSTISVMESFGTRAYALPVADLVAAHIYEEFDSMELQVVMQEFTVGDRLSKNVIAWKNGTDQGRPQILIGAHYDSENMAATDFNLTEALPAPGADDDASGVAAVLEAARLISETITAATVKFVAFGAEEVGFDGSGGCVGSSYYAALEEAAGQEYAATIIIDMIGFRSGDRNTVTLLSNDAADAGASAIRRISQERLTDLDVEVHIRTDVRYSDHFSFWVMGYPSVLVTEELDPISHSPLNPYYHTSEDTLDKLSLDQMVAVTKAIIGGVLLLSEERQEESGTMALVGAVTVVLAGVAVGAVFGLRKRRAGQND